MRCEWRQSNCTKPPTHRLNIALRERGGQYVQYSCEAHALMRISECEDDDRVEILSRDPYEMAASQE